MGKKEKDYKFTNILHEYANSQDKIKEVRFYSNEGVFRCADAHMGSLVFYKDGSVEIDIKGVGYLSVEELNYITKQVNKLLK